MQTQSIRLDEHPQILDLYKALEQNGLHKQKEEVQSLVRYIQNAEQQLSAVAEELAGVRRELHFLHNGTVRAKGTQLAFKTAKQLQQIRASAAKTTRRPLAGAADAQTGVRETGKSAPVHTLGALNIPLLLDGLKKA